MINYLTSLTNSQWQCIKKILNDKRKRKVCLRKVWDAILYQLKTGCQWRMLPKEFGSWSTVYYYFRKWLISGAWHRVQAKLHELVREKHSRKASPSLGIIDSQSVKNSERGVPDKGYDGNKKVKGRKRHIVVDTLGILMCIVVTAANVHDSVAAEQVFKRLVGKYPRLKKILADGGYAGERLGKLAQTELGVELEVVTRSDEAAFKVIPKRWIVERSISWLMWSRRLCKDYEMNTESSEAWIIVASIAMMVKNF
ncbi:MAG: IS5 family transposase [Bacteroidales bacterium]|nr:MAG: IS5 family transposase [Bacteroidales bacterium]